MFLNLLKLPSNRTDCCWFGCLKLEATGLCWRVITDNFLSPPPDIKGRERCVNTGITFSKCWHRAARRSWVRGKSRCKPALKAHSQTCSLRGMAGALATILKSLSLSCASFLSPPPPLSVWGSIFSVCQSVCVSLSLLSFLFVRTVLVLSNLSF